MTLAQQIVTVERRSRVQPEAMTTTNASDVTREYINHGTREFAKRVGGIPARVFMTVTPKFTVPSNFACRLTVTAGSNALVATELPLVSNTYTAAGGASIATAIQQQFSNVAAVSMSITWDTASWVFRVNTLDSNTTHVQIAEPTTISYVDGTPTVFNKTGTQTGYLWSGDFPLDCTLETDLPSDFYALEWVTWDGTRLRPAPFNLFVDPASNGTPSWYAVKESKIRLAPCPRQQERFLLEYRSLPADLSVAGTDDASNCPLPAAYHMAPVYYATAKVLEERHEADKAGLEYGLFDDQVKRYRMQTNNANPTLFPTGMANPIGPVHTTALD